MEIPTPNPLIAAAVAVLALALSILGIMFRWSLRRQDRLETKLEDCTEAHVKVSILEDQVATLKEMTITADVVTDLACNVIWVNEGFTLLFGWTAAEIHGQPVEILLAASSIERHRSAIQRKIEAIRSGDESMAIMRVNEGVGQCKDGQQFAVTVEVGYCLYGDTPAFRAHIRRLGV